MTTLIDMKARAPGVRQQQKQATRGALLAAARAVLGRKGLAGTTTREIAEEAGVAAGTFFVHFPDMGALVEALLDQHIEKALDDAYRTLGKRGDLVERLVHVSKRLYASYDVEPDLSRAYIAGSLFTSSRTGQLTVRLSTFRAWVIAQIDEAVASGAIPDIDRELAFTSYFSLYFGILVAGLSGLMPRKKQIATLEASLRRLLLPKAST